MTETLQNDKRAGWVRFDFNPLGLDLGLATWARSSIPRVPKLTRDGLGFQRNCLGKSDRKLASFAPSSKLPGLCFPCAILSLWKPLELVVFAHVSFISSRKFLRLK